MYVISLVSYVLGLIYINNPSMLYLQDNFLGDNQLEKLEAARSAYLWLPYLALMGLIGPYWALLVVTGPYWVGLTWLYWVSLGLTGPFWALLGLNRP